MSSFCNISKNKLNKQACGCFLDFYNDSLKTDVDDQISKQKKINNIKNILVNIVCEEKHISEKSFSLVKKVVDVIDELGQDRISDMANKMDGKRPEYVAEVIYDELFSDIEIKEEDCLSKTANTKFNLKQYKNS